MLENITGNTKDIVMNKAELKGSMEKSLNKKCIF